MSAATRPDPPSITTLEFLVRLLRWRTMVIVNTLIVAALAVIVSLLLPNWYEAWTSVLPPQEESLTLGPISTGEVGAALTAASEARLALSGRMSLPMWASPSDLLSGILRSRRLREEVIRRHDLLSVYKCETMDEAVDKLRQRTRVRVAAEGIVHLRVLDKEPQRAADIAATFLAKLDEIQRETRHNRAAAVRHFIDDRLTTTRCDLAAAEESLRAFEAQYGLLEPQEQARVLVETAARLEAERLLVQVERDALTGQVGEAHPEVQALDTRLRSLREARAVLEGDLPEAGSARSAHARAPGEAERGGFIDLARFPDLSLDYVRRYRDLRIQESLFEMLTQMREQYRIIEVRDTPTIEVLSPPVVPEEKAKPHRWLICVVATLLAFLCSLGVAVLLEKLTILAERDAQRFAQVQRLFAGVGLGFLVPRTKGRT